ncbi:efflux RND transporter periplasmic adaptor subunit [Vibrio coralliilyticus]|uniref:efflux RND transporter periplasmic adaptor subunit n=1 Tax=Vibrio coralliilyticus TaxID=190893 RepID=UPI0002E4FA3C|nr:efflux RND transporter periplasmic adaptor subunit [Vibrio coralliilyticus]
MRQINIKKIVVSLLALLTIPAAVTYTSYAISNQPQTVIVKDEVLLPKVTIKRLAAGKHHSVIEGYGEAQSADTLTVLAQVSGRVVWKAENFKVGQKVEKGTLLVRIEDSDYQSALANAEKTLADAHLALLQEQRKHQRAQDNWARSEISDKPSLLALREPQLEIAKTQYNAAKKAVENAEKNLSHTKIYAPFDAVVSGRSVTSGSYLSPGSTIGELKASEVAEIKLALSESEWQQLPADLTDLQVDVFSPGNPDSQWLGRATKLSLVIDQATRTRTLTVAVDAPLAQSQPLLFGSFVQVRIKGKALPDSYVIASVSLTADGYIWYEVDATLFRHKAKTLYANTKEIGIARGELAEHINLVRKPMSHYIEGMKVVTEEVPSYAN